MLELRLTMTTTGKFDSYELEELENSEEFEIVQYLKEASELLEDSCERAYFDTVEAALNLRESREIFENTDSHEEAFDRAYASFYEELEEEIAERFPNL
jgi:hypothetical protein